MIRGIREPKQEFLHVDYMVATGVPMLELDPAICGEQSQHVLPHINIGTSFDHTVRDLAENSTLFSRLKWHLCFDADKPNGVPRDLMHASRIQPLEWRPASGLDQRLRDACAWLVSHFSKGCSC